MGLDQTPSAEAFLSQQDHLELIHECLKQKAADLQPGQPLPSCSHKTITKDKIADNFNITNS